MKAQPQAALAVQQIRIDAIAPSVINPRRSISPVQLEELAASIKSAGIQVPLSLRIATGVDHNAVYEIVGGERRWRAAQIAGLETVPAIVREMTDAECRDAGLIENLQREDLPLLDEADAYAGLLETLGSVQALAARVGKQIEYVTRRLKLRSLIEYSRQALAERLITIDHALLLAKLAPAEQEKALKHTLQGYRSNRDDLAKAIAGAIKDRSELAKDRGDYWEPESVLALKSYIENEINLALKDAPWDLTDAKLVESAGPCTTCPSNTAANSALFGDLVIDGASCMDAQCFAAKKKAFVQLQVAKLADAGKDAVRISWKSSDAKPRMIDGSVTQAQVFKAGQWIAAKKGECSFASDAIAVDDDTNSFRPDDKKKIGAKLLVCVAAGCKAHKKAWEGVKPKTAATASRYDPKAEEEKRAKAKAAVAAENKIRLELAKQAIEKTAKLGEFLRVLTVGSFDLTEIKEVYPAWQAAISSPIASVHFAKLIAAMALSRSGLEVNQWQSPDAERKEFLAMLKILGVDGSRAWDKKPEPQAAKKQVPSPAPKAPAKSKAAKPKASPAAKKTAKKGGRK